MTTKSPPKRDSVRFSTYSGAPSIQPSIAMSTSTSTSQDLMNDSSKTIESEKYKAATVYGMEKTSFQPAASTTSLASSDPRSQEISSWSAGFERMQDQRLEKQRYTMSGKKSDEVSITALGAKVERALGRRMTGQDATFTAKGQGFEEVPIDVTDKRSVEVEAV